MNSSEKNKIPEKKLIENSKTTKYYITTNNVIMDEIQELLTDQDLIKKELIGEDENYYTLEIIFPEEITQKKTDIKFLLLISKQYPTIEPELYCLTVFSHPHLCDGRNLINNIINGDWANKKYPIESIINKIPKFIIKHIETKSDSTKIGKYILNKIYKINFLKKLPIFLHFITNENKILTISDISLCIYLLDKNIGFCTLSFYIDIKDIIKVNPNPKKNKIEIKYKSSLNNKIKKFNINTANVETINAILNEKMKIYQQKTGKLPNIDINNVEKEIEEKEIEQKDNEINLEKKLYLMSLYQKAVEYYSAINNPKFIEINHKIHKLLENTQLENTSKDINIDKKVEEKINVKKDDNKNILNNAMQENKNKIEIKKEENPVHNNIQNNKKEDKEEKKIVEKKEEMKNEIVEKKEDKKTEDKKEDNKKIENKQNDKKEKIEEKNNQKLNKDNKKEENKEENKDNKGEKASLRLKIDKGEIGTLDVGDEEEEEEEGDEK